MKCSIVLILLSFSYSYSQQLILRDTTNQFDYIIVTVPEFVSSIQQFKAHKESYNGFKVLIADTTAIFNEFNSSVKPEENIREFISYAGSYWSNPTPKYFLLAGDLDKIPNHKFVFTLFWTIIDTVETDYYYSQNINNPDTISIDFYIGRVSAKDQNELNNYFSKVIDYETDQTIYSWQNNSAIISDDRFGPTGYEGKIWEWSALDIGNNAPDYINVKYIFSSDSSNYYGTKDTLIDFINNTGVSSLFFVGHGNDSQFTHEAFLTLDDLALINNGNKYFVPYFLTKQSFSNSNRQSMVNKMIVSENMAIAAFNTVGIVYSLQASKKGEALIRHLYSSHKLSIGEVADSVLSSAVSSQNNSYNIFGDPSIKIKYDVIADVPGEDKILSDFTLHQNYPNPFNPATKISFTIPLAGNVELKVYDILGKEVALLADNFYTAGKYTIEFDASFLSSGVYFYRLKSGDLVQNRKMILLK
jgi:hypothetical protein